MFALASKTISTNTTINLIILGSGSCLALCLYLLGPAYPLVCEPAFAPMSLQTSMP